MPDAKTQLLRRRARVRLAATGLWLVALLALAGPASAEPYFAVREGLRCSACHVNMTGGGGRTELVAVHANELLHIPKMFAPLSRPAEYFNGDVMKYLRLGSDFRTSYTAQFQDEPNAAGRVKNNQVYRGRLEQNDFDTTGNLYVDARLIPDYVTAYTDVDVINGTAREAFGMLQGVLPWDGFVKAGKIFIPYGLQLWDDSALIREDTFTFNNRESGVEVGFEPGPLTWILAITNGPSGDRDVRVTSTTYTMFTDVPVVRNVMVGSSFSRVGSSSGDRVVYGFFGGTNLERLTVLAEIDFRDDALDLQNNSTNPPTKQHTHKGQFIGYAEADYLFFDWCNFKITFDYSDNDRVGSNLTKDSRNRVTFGIEPFFSRFLQLRLFYSIANGVESVPNHNQNELYAEAHMFF